MPITIRHESPNQLMRTIFRGGKQTGLAERESELRANALRQQLQERQLQWQGQQAELSRQFRWKEGAREIDFRRTQALQAQQLQRDMQAAQFRNQRTLAKEAHTRNLDLIEDERTYKENWERNVAPELLAEELEQRGEHDLEMARKKGELEIELTEKLSDTERARIKGRINQQRQNYDTALEEGLITPEQHAQFVEELRRQELGVEDGGPIIDPKTGLPQGVIPVQVGGRTQLFTLNSQGDWEVISTDEPKPGDLAKLYNSVAESMRDPDTDELPSPEKVLEQMDRILQYGQDTTQSPEVRERQQVNREMSAQMGAFIEAAEAGEWEDFATSEMGMKMAENVDAYAEMAAESPEMAHVIEQARLDVEDAIEHYGPGWEDADTSYEAWMGTTEAPEELVELHKTLTAISDQSGWLGRPNPITHQMAVESAMAGQITPANVTMRDWRTLTDVVVGDTVDLEASRAALREIYFTVFRDGKKLTTREYELAFAQLSPAHRQAAANALALIGVLDEQTAEGLAE